MNTQDGSQTEVVLRDFDGSRTIFETDLPLRDVISAAKATWW